MLKDQDRIFQNLYNDKGSDVSSSQERGDWVNTKEIPNNGKDDDNNGYVDDINGWNFLGTIYKENAEVERILKNPKLVDDATYQKIKAAQDKKIAGAEGTKKQFTQMLQAVQFADNTLAEYLKKKNYTKDEVTKIKSDKMPVMQSVNIAKQMYGFGLSSLTQGISEIKKEIKNAEDLLSGNNLKTNYRKPLNDNAQDFTTRGYGNGKTGHLVDDEIHGTHVSGIIGAERNNNVGMNGVAHNVKIGSNCMIAGQVGFAGSTIVGDNVVIGGQAGISGHLVIGDNVKIGGGSGVINNIPDNSQVMGYPAIPLKDFVKQRKK